jgi:nucleoside-diphosphate-sugar epimerase
MQRVAITGGSGFLGRRLAASLLDDAGLGIQEVRLLDLHSPAPVPFAPSTQRTRYSIGGSDERLQYRKCDLRNQQEVTQALANIDTIIHLASYGMSGAEMLNVAMIDAVNLSGTAHVIEAARKLHIPRMVYVSTYNVVFGKNEIINGDEDKVPYWPLEQFHDEYSKTKRMAEEMALQANSTGQAKARTAQRMQYCARLN